MFEGKKAWQALVVGLLAVVMLGSVDPSRRYERVGHNLMCMCGCGQVLLDCNHVGCPVSGPMIGELRDELNGPDGRGADAVVTNWFVAKYGAVVLAAPIRGGFDNVAWIAPFTLLILGVFGTALTVRLWSQRRRTQVAAVGVPVAGLDDAVRDRIRRETEWR